MAKNTETKTSGQGSSSDRLSQSPRSIREGNEDPMNIGPEEVSLGLNEPSRSDDPAWKHQGEQYSNKYW